MVGGLKGQVESLQIINEKFGTKFVFLQKKTEDHKDPSLSRTHSKEFDKCNTDTQLYKGYWGIKVSRPD